MTFESICARDVAVDTAHHAHTLPIYASSTFLYGSPDRAMDVFQGKEQAYIYSRWSNPTVKAVEDKIAALEGFDLPDEAYTILFSTGMAAIAATFMATLQPGDKVLTHHNIYGTTTELLHEVLQPLGIEPIFVNYDDLSSIEEIVEKDPAIKMLYVESPNNPSLAVYDLTSIKKLATKFNLITAIDATFASPYLQRPLNYGFDYVIHSTTKYLNGHSTALGGAVTTLLPKAQQKRLWQIRKTTGAMLSPMDAWLLNNGIKTLPLRLQQACSTALTVAEWLDEQDAILCVNYPGLEQNRYFAMAQKMLFGSGAMMSFELAKGLEAGMTLMQEVKMCSLTATLGTADTLIQHPASMTHANVPLEQRLAGGITDGMIRLSIGLEHPQDIINDLKQAFDKIK